MYSNYKLEDFEDITKALLLVGDAPQPKKGHVSKHWSFADEINGFLARAYNIYVGYDFEGVIIGDQVLRAGL